MFLDLPSTAKGESAVTTRHLVCFDSQVRRGDVLMAKIDVVCIRFDFDSPKRGMIAFFIGTFGAAFIIGSSGLDSASIAVLAAIGIVVLLYLLVLFFISTVK